MGKGKITRAHSSYVEAAAPLVDAAQKMPEVKKIALGVIKPVRRGKGIHRIKFTAITGGWKIRVRGTAVVQELYVYASDPEYVKQALEDAFASA